MRLDHTNPDSVTKCTASTKRTLYDLRNGMHRCTAYECCEPLDVRLVANQDGELWFATGNAQYDTVHGIACETISLSPDNNDDDIDCMATDLVNGVASQLSENE